MIDFDVVTGSGPGLPQEKPAALPAAPALRPPLRNPAPVAAATDPAPTSQRPGPR